MNERLLYETHMHTPLCKHATGMPLEYAAVAAERGLRGITVTCHSPMPDDFSASVRMSPDEFPQYLDLVSEAARQSDQVEVLLGMESDFFPGMESWIETLHGKADFQYILGSVHPQIPEFAERFGAGDWPTFHRLYFEQLVAAAETGLFDCLAHPDIVKNMGTADWDLPALLPTIQKALDRIAATGIAMELNTSGVNKTMPEMNPSRQILAEMKEREIPVVIGADAHRPSRVGDGYETAIRMLQDAGYERLSYFIGRQRQELSLQDALESLRQPV